MSSRMNVWQMPELLKYLQRHLELDNGHLLVQVLKSNGILPRVVHKELGIISRKKCWNSQKLDILLSVQRLHCPGVFSRAKDMENCRYTSLQIKTQLIQFIALFFLSISCEEFESHQDRSGQLVILVGQWRSQSRSSCAQRKSHE